MSFGSCVRVSYDRHCCVVVERGDIYVQFIQNSDGLVEVYQMNIHEFDRTFIDEFHDYPVARFAELLLTGPTPITPRAAKLLRQLKEPTMATSKNAKKSPAAASSKKPAPKKTEKEAAAPKAQAMIGKVVNAGKTDAKVDAPAPKKADAKPATKTAAPKAEGEPRGRRGMFSDPETTLSLVKAVKEDSDLKKRARMIAGFIEDAGKKATVKQLLGKIQKELDKLGQRDPAEAILSVHGRALVEGGFVKVG